MVCNQMSLEKEIVKAQEEQVSMFGEENALTEWPLPAMEFEAFKDAMAYRCKTDQQKEMLRLSRRLFVKTPHGQVAVFEALQ